jgi:hypothetical protein
MSTRIRNHAPGGSERLIGRSSWSRSATSQLFVLGRASVSGDGNQLGLVPVQFREKALQGRDLGQVEGRDIAAVGIKRRVVLMIVLGRIERLRRLDRGDDRRAEDMGLVQLPDIGGRHLLLRGALSEDRRAVLGAAVRTWRLSSVGSCATEK